MRKQFDAKARYVRFSPPKLRPLANVIRGKDVTYALNFLVTHPVRRALPIAKMLKSAVANAKNLENVDQASLYIKEIKVDQGPTRKYFKPGAMGRTNAYRKRFSHLSITLERITEKKED